MAAYCGGLFIGVLIWRAHKNSLSRFESEWKRIYLYNEVDSVGRQCTSGQRNCGSGGVRPWKINPILINQASG